MVVVTRAIEVCRHHAAVIAAILAVVAFAQLDARNFGNGIRRVGRLKRATQQGIFLHGLGCQAWVNATATQKKQLLHAMDMRGMNDVGLHHQVLIDELCGVGAIGINPAHFGGCEIDLCNLVRCEKVSDRLLIAQIKLGVRAGQQLRWFDTLSQ